MKKNFRLLIIFVVSELIKNIEILRLNCLNFTSLKHLLIFL